MAQKPHQFHITFSPPNDGMPHWPQGFWALYEISGDQIADRIVKNADGEIVIRHSWPGFVNGFGSLDEVATAIKGLTT